MLAVPKCIEIRRKGCLKRLHEYFPNGILKLYMVMYRISNDTDIINGGGIMGKLNKESSVPLYQQLMEVIQNQILNGELKENDRIPT